MITQGNPTEYVLTHMRMTGVRWWLCLLFLAGSLPAFSQTQSEVSLSPDQAVRYQHLLEELRCLVCQNQSLAESNAELAGDLRSVVLDMVKADKSDDEIFNFLTERYGSFVRYRPPFNWTTVLLWFAPFIVLIIAMTLLFRRIAKQNKLQS